MHRYIISCLLIAFIFHKAAPQSNHDSLRHTGRAYYVSVHGNDAGQGTKDLPFRTIMALNAIKILKSDTIYFQGGETFKGNLELQIEGGEKQAALITSFGKGFAEIDAGGAEGINISGSNFILRNLHITGAGRKTGNRTNGVLLTNVSNAILDHLEIDSFQLSGLEIFKSSNLIISSVTSSHNGQAGISIDSSINCILRNCRAKNNPGNPVNLTNHSGNGILVGYSSHVIIDHCTATNNGWDMPRKGNGPVGIWTYESEYILIQYCISYRNKTSPGSSDGGGFDLDGGVRNSIIQYCLSFENQGSGYGLFQYSGAGNWSNNVVRYCISVNDGKVTTGASGILVWNNSGDSMQLSGGSIYNNIILNDRVPCINFLEESRNNGFLFFNNIFIGSNYVVNGPVSGERFTGNIWWGHGKKLKYRNYTGLKEWSKNTGQEIWEGRVIGKEMNPELQGPLHVNLKDPRKLGKLKGFRLKHGSPVYNLYFSFPGLEASAVQDFYGYKIPIGTRIRPGLDQSIPSSVRTSK